MRIFNLLTAVVIGACATLSVMACSSNPGGSSSAIVGAGGACTVDADCVTGLECEHGVCTADDDDDDEVGEVENEHEDEHDAGVALACTVSTDCPAGQECDDGRCKVDDHDGHSGSDD